MDEKTITAIRESAEHHKDNLHKLRTLEGEFRTGIGHYFYVGKEEISFDADVCALCKLFLSNDGCDKETLCPLAKAGFRCNNTNSPWGAINQVKTKPEAIKAEERMVEVLEGLLPKFKVGDKVRAKEERACESCRGRELTIVSIDNSRAYPIEVTGTISKNEPFIEEALEKMEASMYNSLKARIEKVTAWDKEADDILEEMDLAYYIMISDKEIKASYNKYEKAIMFPFSSQCEKREAFKKAMMYLLDHSDIKDIVGQEAQVKIEGEDYKVKVLEKL